MRTVAPRPKAIPAPLPLPATGELARVISIRDLRTYCSSCSVRQLCLPVGLDSDMLQKLDRLVKDRVRLKKGEVLYRAGDAFSALYAIRIGSCKTTVLSEDGREQVAGYHMRGDMLGMDGIGAERYGCEAVALEDSECCVLPFDELGELTRSAAPLQHNLYQFLSREIARGQDIMLLLGSMRADGRLAAFKMRFSAGCRWLAMRSPRSPSTTTWWSTTSSPPRWIVSAVSWWPNVPGSGRCGVKRKGSSERFFDCERTQMIDRSKLSNSFEFVVTAGARARQLMAGSVPRVTVGEHKKTTVAQQEVVTKVVEKIEPEAPVK